MDGATAGGGTRQTGPGSYQDLNRAARPIQQ